MARDRALLVVDVQRDFCPGGALAVPGGDEVVPVLNDYINCFLERGLPVVLSRDWHPAQTTHFKEWGGLWPPHCIHETAGASFHPDLEVSPGAHVVSKGTDPERDSYSAFQGTDEQGRPLGELLRSLGARTLYVGGLATDYCVKHTVIDARRAGIDTILLADAVRGIDAVAGDVQRALEEMREYGVRVARLGAIRRELETLSAKPHA